MRCVYTHLLDRHGINVLVRPFTAHRERGSASSAHADRRVELERLAIMGAVGMDGGNVIVDWP